MPLDESYTTDSGFFTDYEGEVIDAYFGTWEKSKKNPNALFLWLKMKTDSVDHPEYEERLGLGDGWVTEDGGETVVSENNARKFNKRFSQYAKWIDAAVPLIINAGVADQFGERGPTQHAKIWLGTRWQIGEVTEKYQRYDAEAKKPMVDEHGKPVMGESRQNVPVAFLGFVGEGGARANGQGQAADVSFVPDELREKLIESANKSANREAFLNRVMLDVPEASQVEGLVGKLAGRGVWEGLRV